MTQRLSVVIALDKATKNRCNNDITALYHMAQKADLFKGIARRYESNDEDGEKLPPETRKVQQRGTEILDRTAALMTQYWDITLTKESANTGASADVVVDGVTIISAAPVGFLLFLERQLVDLATTVRKIPVLDPGETWKHDAASDCWATEPKTSNRMKKVPKAFEKAPATKEHPAQVETYHEDVIVGKWITTDYSGALPQERITKILERISKLQAAVKFAREEANSSPAPGREVGKAAFAFLFA